MSIRSGISEGRHETSTVRRRIARTPVLVLDAQRLADHVDRHFDRDLLVHPHRLEVDVDERVPDGMELDVPDDGRSSLGLAWQAKPHQDTARRVGADRALHLGRGDRQRHGGVPGPVQDGGDEAAPAQTPDGPLPRAVRGSADSSRMFMTDLLGASAPTRTGWKPIPRRGCAGSPPRGAAPRNRDFGLLLVLTERDRVRDDHLLERGVLDPRHRRAGEHRVHGAGHDPPRALALERVGGLDQRPGRVDHVVDDDGVPALHVADDVHELGRRSARRGACR